MDLKTHNDLREKVREAYLQVSAKGIYYNSRGNMCFTYKGPDKEIHKVYLDPMASSVVVNSLVPKSGVILLGGHGGGKTTLVEKVSYMLTGIDEDEIASAMIRGNDDQNVNTLLSTLKLGKLMVQGEEEVTWRNFVTCYVKIIDELNRFPPPAQNALFELLNKGRVEFMDKVYELDDFIAYATINPNDPGTYAVSRPFIDRFSFCVPAPQLPSAADQHLLAERPDDKLVSVKVSKIMGLDEIKKARRMIAEDVKMSPEAQIYSIYLTQAISTCERGDYFDKSHNDIPVGERCKGCAFDNASAVCKMTETGISGRAFLDFQRWGKAYAWFLNAFENPEVPEVQLDIIKTIAPYLMYHRIQPAEAVFAKAPYYGMKMSFLEDLVKKATDGYLTVREALMEIPEILRGDKSPERAKINNIDKDLVVAHNFKPLVEEAGKKEFRDLYDQIEAGKNLSAIKAKILLGSELGLPAKNYLLSRLLEKAN